MPSITIELTAAQVEQLTKTGKVTVKPGKGIVAGKATKTPKVAKAPGEKGETPPHLVKWNSYVDSVLAELKGVDTESAWELYAATEPVSKPKKGSDSEAESLVTDETKEKFKVTRKVAMAIASWRKKNGTMPEEFIYIPMTAEEKAAAKEARSVASETTSTTKAPKKPTAAKKPIVAKPVPVVEAVPPLPEEDEDEGEVAVFVDFTNKGKTYIQLPDGSSWVKNSNGDRGKWAGRWDGKKFDTTAPEPVFEES